MTIRALPGSPVACPKALALRATLVAHCGGCGSRLVRQRVVTSYTNPSPSSVNVNDVTGVL